MFKRRIFFRLERLKISPAERKAVTFLVIVLTVLGILNLVLTPRSPFAGEYPELERQFRQRTEMVEKQNRELMKRYEPSHGGPGIIEAATDTLPPDTLRGRKSDPSQRPALQKININGASPEELQKLPGIGPVYAKRILEYRTARGKFASVDELLKINGIGKKRLEKLLPFVKLKDSE